MDATSMVHYIDVNDYKYDEQVDIHVNEMFSDVTRSVDLSTISVQEFMEILDSFHELMTQIESDYREFIAHTIIVEPKKVNYDITKIQNLHKYLADQGHESRANLAYRYLNEYKQMIAQFSMALDLMDIDSIHRCMRKPKPKVALQKKIDQGVLKKYGTKMYQRFMLGQPLPVGDDDYLERQSVATTLAALYYDRRLFEKWRQVALPDYYIYIHPAQVKVAFEALLKSISKRIQKGDNAIETAAWAYCEFIDIHRYLDGNGRVGRVLLNLVLRALGSPVVDISNNVSECVLGPHTEQLVAHLIRRKLAEL